MAIVFYCRDCEKVIENPVKHPKKYEYTCATCNSNRVVFGTSQAIQEYFHIKKMPV